MNQERKWPAFDFVVGRVTRNPEDRMAGSRPVVAFGIAVNKSFDKGDSEFLDVTVFSERRFDEARALQKGDRIAMEGTRKEREHNGKTYVDFVPMSIYRAVQVEAEDDL